MSLFDFDNGYADLIAGDSGIVPESYQFPDLLDDVSYPCSTIPEQCLLAYWLYKHPGIIIERDDTIFFYENGCFMYRKPKNKVHNKCYRARGLDSWLKRARRYFRFDEE